MRTTVNIDPTLVEEVARLLHTDSLSETVAAALREVVAVTKRARLAARIRNGDLPVPTAEEVRRVRAQRLKSGGLSK